MSERLQSTLTSLSKEKDLLECSLRQEMASNHQLGLEKAGTGGREGGREEGERYQSRLKLHVAVGSCCCCSLAPGLAEQVEELEASLAQTREELSQLQVHTLLPSYLCYHRYHSYLS